MDRTVRHCNYGPIFNMFESKPYIGPNHDFYTRAFDVPARAIHVAEYCHNVRYMKN